MKEATKQINIRVTEKDKEKLESNAKLCGLSLSEFLRQRGLLYVPRPLPPALFYEFYSQLCDLCNKQMTHQTEAEVLDLVDDIRTELILPGKETRKEVAQWQPQASGR